MTTLRHGAITIGLAACALACDRTSGVPDPSVAEPRIAVVVKGALYTVRPDGTDPLPVAPLVRRPAWSPDRAQFVFEYPSRRSDSVEIGLVNADGTGEHTILGPGWYSAPTWSPDGSRIAVVQQNSDGTTSILAVSLSGTVLDTLRDQIAYDHDPAWSPDGQHLAFVSNCLDVNCNRAVSDLWVADGDGASAVRLTAGVAIDDDATRPTWSPDGEWIAFEKLGDIYRIRANGADLEQLTFGSTAAAALVSYYSPSYAPDGESLAFAEHYYRSSTDHGGFLVIARTDGSGPLEIPLGLGEPSELDWGP